MPNETTADAAKIDRAAKALWKEIAPMLHWPQSAVTWHRMADVGKESMRAKARKILEAAQ